MAKTKNRDARRHVSRAVVHIRATLDGTTVTITDPDGKALCRASSGAVGFKGSREGTPFAAQRAAETAAAAATKFGFKEIEVKVKGPGSGRDSAIAALRASGLSIQAIEDVTGLSQDAAPMPGRVIQFPVREGHIKRQQAEAAVEAVMRRRDRTRGQASGR